METWKTSTLLVIGAFVLSVLFLVFTSNPFDRGVARARGPIDSEIYSPAAADPDLRSPELADRVRASAKPRARQTAQKVSVPVPTPKVVKPKVVVAAPTAVLPEVTAPPKNENVPEGHHYYVIVGTYSNPQNAERALAAFQKKGAGKPFVGVFNEGQRFSVIAQTFENEAKARVFVKALRDKHSWTDAFINFVED
ncbi:MAG: SPOR domain-containing protein [Saprospiraceae bacterium]